MSIEITTSDQGWVEERGVRVWGRRVRDVEARDIEGAEVPLKTELHVIRHLVRISPEVRSRLRGARLIEEDGDERIIDDAFLDAELAAAGSKFHHVIIDPETIIKFARGRATEMLDRGERFSWIEHPQTKQQRTRLVLTATDVEKHALGIPGGAALGTLSVLPLTDEIALRVRRELRGKGEERDQIEVNTVSGIEPPTTDDAVLELVRLSPDAPVEIYTAYTGFLAPHLPRRSEQTDEEFAYNQRWWDAHAFVK